MQWNIRMTLVAYAMKYKNVFGKYKNVFGKYKNVFGKYKNDFGCWANYLVDYLPLLSSLLEESVTYSSFFFFFRSYTFTEPLFAIILMIKYKQPAPIKM